MEMMTELLGRVRARRPLLRRAGTPQTQRNQVGTVRQRVAPVARF
ncbi:MAG: hypothetical protein ACK4P5_03060 [Fimbriimonadales bacterium]